MNHVLAQTIDSAIELTLGSLRLVIAPPRYHSAERVEADALNLTPADFYRLPADPPAVQFAGVHKWFDGRTHARFQFPSYVESPYPQNNIVHGLADLQEGCESCGALILLHGYQMNTFAPLKWFAEPAARAGFDIYYMSLPYHMRRAPSGTWSGQLGLSADIEGTIQSFRQGVLDLRALISFVTAVQKKPVAIAGLSLGAFTSCMAATVDDRPFALVSLLGGASLADLVFAGFSFRLIRKELQESGIQPKDLEQWWRIMAPANWPPRLPAERILLFAGEHDPIVTPANTRRLWNAWGRPRMHWIPCGHASIAFYARQIGERMVDFLLDRVRSLP